MGYIRVLKNLKKNNKVFFFNYKKNSFFEGLYRYLAIFLSPILINLNPNIISYTSLILGFIGLIAYIIFQFNLTIIIVLFLLSFIFDFIDGLVARFKKKTSFYGRFIDGLFDIFVIGFLHVVFFDMLSRSNNLLINHNYYILIILFLPVQHMILDRFSALARWCNELKGKKKFKPYFRNNFFNNLTFFLFDIQHLCIFSLLFLGIDKKYHVIQIYFILSAVSSLISILIYIYLGKKFFSNISNQNYNNE